MAKSKFGNMDPVSTQKTSKHFKRWRQEKIWNRQGKDYSFCVPNSPPDLEFLHHNRSKPSMTWIGHSTFLLQLAGVNIVTDPVWAGKMAFQRRLTPPGVPLESMPPVDLVLVSHSHYDHLHMASLRRLGGSKTILVPAGLGAKLKAKGFPRVHELHWWESYHFRGLKLTFVPSQHWTRRNPWDMNASHWGGWVIQPEHGLDHEPGEGTLGGVRSHPPRPDEAGGPGGLEEGAAAENGASAADAGPFDPFHPDAERPRAGLYPTVYFAGDSGYFRGFADIGRKFRIDVAMLPIGAYDPEEFMGPQHTTPEQALQAFLDTRARLFVPMHYGAFKLADDTPQEALDRLENARRQAGLEAGRLVLLPHGETWRMNG
ncbi:MBL fold metallo-hydrolase [Paenibacillus pasadenensis]|uniref:Outer membrane protein romA n=1 Tax=Paenibacillus pasadenensis TaxID=217090 RepID=A0A2N5N342_9BACL|nr:MBL fold metallo-hydrolase [Paenibacillus pasadenensis]PLT44730.1 Outer membrane protein romA [Paenibacillus pasadenensis]